MLRARPQPAEPSNLRPAPASLTPVVADRLVMLAAGLCGAASAFDADQIPQDASVANSGRTNGNDRSPGDVPFPRNAAVEAGRDSPFQVEARR